MATYTSTACQTNASGFFLNPPKYVEQGAVVKTAAFAFTTSASPGDVVQMVTVPKGANITDVVFAITGGMAATSNVGLQAGDGNSTTRFSTSQTAGAQTGTGAVFRMNNAAGVGYSYSADDTIDLVIGTVGSMSAQMSVRLTVTYSMDQSGDGNS